LTLFLFFMTALFGNMDLQVNSEEWRSYVSQKCQLIPFHTPRSPKKKLLSQLKHHRA
jgi:hypothetical protein